MLINFIAGLLGMIFLTLGKMKSLQTDAEKANVEFSTKKYFQKDWIAILMSFCSIFIWLLVFSEVVAKYPQLQGFVVCSFVAMGAIGSWVIQAALGKTKGWIRGIVDTKTNIADNKTS